MYYSYRLLTNITLQTESFLHHNNNLINKQLRLLNENNRKTDEIISYMDKREFLTAFYSKVNRNAGKYLLTHKQIRKAKFKARISKKVKVLTKVSSILNMRRKEIDLDISLNKKMLANSCNEHIKTLKSMDTSEQLHQTIQASSELKEGLEQSFVQAREISSLYILAKDKLDNYYLTPSEN